MISSRNQHTDFELPHVTNQYGDTDEHHAALADLTMAELYERGCVIKDSTGCHVWTRAKMSGHLYGVINLRGANGKSKTYSTHRLVMHLQGAQDYADAKHVLHRCHKAFCVNPEHLYLGTNVENARDRAIRYPRVSGHRPHRPSWKEVWFYTAQLIAFRSECVRRQAGCVMVDEHGHIVGSGFNGKPGNFPVSGSCDTYCPRAVTGGSLTYNDCVFVHSEMNALMTSDHTRRRGGTAYVTSCPCLDCAKALGNSGLKTVICAVGTEDRNRDPRQSVELMMQSGLFVEIYYAPKISLPLPSWSVQ